MNYVSCLISVVLLCGSCEAYALEDGGASQDDRWLQDQLSLTRESGWSEPTLLNVDRIEFWERGLKTVPMAPVDEAFGAKLRPIEHLDFRIGTELVQTRDAENTLNSSLDWTLAWSGELQFQGMAAGLSASGRIDSDAESLTETLGGHVKIALAPRSALWMADLRVSPEVEFNLAEGVGRVSLKPEVVGEADVSLSDRAFKSVLGLRLGADFALDNHPSAFAKLELKIAPRS